MGEVHPEEVRAQGGSLGCNGWPIVSVMNLRDFLNAMITNGSPLVIICSDGFLKPRSVG